MTTQQKNEVLEKLQKMFANDYIAAELKKELVNGQEMTVLYTLQDDLSERGEEAVGQFSFLPVESAEGSVEFFVMLFVLAEEIGEKEAEPLLKAMNEINYYLAGAAFSYSRKEKLVVLKAVTALPSEYTPLQAFDIIDCTLGSVQLILDRYSSILLRFLEGSADLEELRGYLPVNIR